MTDAIYDNIYHDIDNIQYLNTVLCAFKTSSDNSNNNDNNNNKNKSNNFKIYTHIALMMRTLKGYL